MVELIVAAILICILLFIVYTVLSMPMFASIPQQLKTLVYLLIFVLVLFWLLGKMGLMPAGF